VHLGVARANALQARTSKGADADADRTKALAPYGDFLGLVREAMFRQLLHSVAV